MSDKRDEIIYILKTHFAEKNGINLPIFGVDSSNLTQFTTTEKDAKRGQSRFPPNQFRLREEDVLRESETQMLKAEVIDSTAISSVMDDYAENLMLRNKQYEESKQQNTYDDEEDDAEDAYSMPDPTKEPTTRASLKQGGNLIFSREQARQEESQTVDPIKAGVPAPRLQEFQILRMIGKGTFGKVYLVQHITTKQIYAMKCIRKDIVVENEQYENIKLEKEILYTVDHPFIVNMEFVFQNEFRIYFIMRFVKGGELFRHLVKMKRFKEEQARFFIA